MGSSTKKHKNREPEKEKKKHKRSPERSRKDEDRRKSHKEKKHKKKRDYESDSSDCVEVPLDLVPPPPPTISKSSFTKSSSSKPSQSQVSKVPAAPSKSTKAASPLPENGAGDCLSIEETNKLRAKLGLKPLDVGKGPVETSSTSRSKKDKSENGQKAEQKEHNKYKDDFGEFYHKPATNIAKTTAAVKIRDKIQEKKEKRSIENQLSKTKTLGESDTEDGDDIKKWVKRTREVEKSKKEAEKRARLLEEMDEEFGVDTEDQVPHKRAKTYRDKDLQGLRVEHDVDAFSEGKQVILTLKDKDVLDDADDALVNVNMLDDERYKQSNENKKKVGYNAYEDEELDELGMPKMRTILKKYDDETEANHKSSFNIGQNVEDEIAHRKKVLEIKAKLQNKRIESLNTPILTLANDYYNSEELQSFKKPKKKIRKIRQKLKADDLLAIAGDATTAKDLGSRNRSDGGGNKEEIGDDLNLGVEDEMDQMLAKARRLKQKEAVINKAIHGDSLQLKTEVKSEPESDDEEAVAAAKKAGKQDSNQIVLNATAEFCRTLGDIPTYGQAGNRDDNADMDFDEEQEEKMQVDDDSDVEIQGQWASVDAYEEMKNMKSRSNDLGESAILDEEPDVASGVGAALRLAMSKGYLEKEESNRPSNSRFAHLQAKNYSIEDKAYGDDDKYSRRDRYSGPLSDFREKETFKPNVKLEYIDDSGHLLSAKEAFRYLSHKFHGKGPGKNKVEKRLKKGEQEGLMKQMHSNDTPLNTLSLLQAKQKETHCAFVVLSGSKVQNAACMSKQKR